LGESAEALRQRPAARARTGRPDHLWAVILAGGDGTRLQCLSQRVAGDSRPKQFCDFLGRGSLLAETRLRVSTVVPPEQQLFVVTRSHERWYREELRDVPPSRLIVQPENRGTALAISVGILRALQEDPDAMVAVLPSDHYYSNEGAFASALWSASRLSGQFLDSIVLLGATATHPEVEYGWIEPGTPVPHRQWGDAFQVKRFWEKPTAPLAKELLSRECLWNTFVTVGQASTFLDMLCLQLPGTISRILECEASQKELCAAYGSLSHVDFSRDVLTPQADRLLALRDPLSGWLDLGSPARLRAAMAQHGKMPDWLDVLENSAGA
jgi:mannose-1-phosphate guanylyltransferase